ncbi:hypothetical protein ABVT39_024539 [Epinephelus coioides]
MEVGDDSGDEIIEQEHCSTEGPVEYKGIRTHFWLEGTYVDNKGAEHWQDEQEIKQKLWQITKFTNLKKVKEVAQKEKKKRRKEEKKHKLEYNPYREKKYKTAITVGKIIVLIRTKETDEQPVKVVMQQHPSRVKHIKRCVSKWHKRTSGKNRWPM